MIYKHPQNFKLRWHRVRRADRARQYAVQKQITFTKMVKRDSFSIAMPKGINVACAQSGSLLFVYLYDCVGWYEVQLVAGWIRDVRYYDDARTLVVRNHARYPTTSFMFAEHYKIARAFHTMFVCRLRMRGRLYRIYRRNKYRDLQYRIGFSHYITVQIGGLYVKYIRKKKIRIFGLDYHALLAKSKQARDRFPVCKYTQRGVRMGGDRCFAKIGKTVKYY